MCPRRHGAFTNIGIHGRDTWPSQASKNHLLACHIQEPAQVIAGLPAGHARARNRRSAQTIDAAETRRPAPPRIGCGASSVRRCSRRWPAPVSHRGGCDGTPRTSAPCISVRRPIRRRTARHHAASPRAPPAGRRARGAPVGHSYPSRTDTGFAAAVGPELVFDFLVQQRESAGEDGPGITVRDFAAESA